MFRALDELGSKMPINDFNTMVCAFRVTKNSIIQRPDFMSVFNKASLALVSGSPKANKSSQQKASRPSSSMRVTSNKVASNANLKEMLAAVRA